MLPINVSQLLLSMRDSGYSLSEGVAEVIDNSIEAGASYINIDIINDSNNNKQIIFSDDGIGMSADECHRYLVLGESSRYFSTKSIGKYGVGAKAGAYSICKRIDVYSRPEGTARYHHTYYDLNALNDGKSQVDIIEPQITPLPSHVYEITQSNANTVVVWSHIDRFPQRSFNAVLADLRSEVGRMFRRFIHKGFQININNQRTMHIDPTYQLEGSYQDRLLTNAYDSEEAPIRHFEPFVIRKNYPLIELENEHGEKETATVTVVLLNPAITRQPGMGGDSLARALKLKYGEGKISYMRNHREVGFSSFHNALGRQVRSEDRFLGIEVCFSPLFDEHFGTRMVKRGIEPKDNLKAKLKSTLKEFSKIGIDQLMTRWKNNGEQTDMPNFDEIERAVERLNVLFAPQPKPREDKNTNLDDLLQLASEIGISSSEHQKEYAITKSQRPYILEVVTSSHDDQFVDFTCTGSHTIIRINSSHAIYKTVWAPLQQISTLRKEELEFADASTTAKHALESLNLMIIAFAKEYAQNPNEFSDQIARWSSSLDKLIKHVNINR